MNLYHPIKLPGLTIPGNLFLAPMAGYTDRAFREVAISFGADLVYTEMISSEGIIRKNKKTLDLLDRGENERFWGIQIFSDSPERSALSLASLLPLSPSLIDLNCGCPVPKVTSPGAGSALLRKPDLLYKTVKALWGYISDSGKQIPLTVKIRSGWDNSSINYQETALAAVEAGAVMITLHPRTRNQGYGGKADWEHLARLSESLSVPVIGSGDLNTPEQAINMLKETRCAGLMFARGALGNPFIFRDTREFMETGILPEPPARAERINTALRHLLLASQYLGEKRACREMRKHICAYIKGIPGSSVFRGRIVHAETIPDYEREFESFGG